jgi:hypothetical protein
VESGEHVGSDRRAASPRGESLYQVNSPSLPEAEEIPFKVEQQILSFHSFQ